MSTTNFRRYLKHLLKNAERAAWSDGGDPLGWGGRRDRFVRDALAPFGVFGGYGDVSRFLLARSPTGKPIRGRALKRVGRRALRDGMLFPLVAADWMARPVRPLVPRFAPHRVPFVPPDFAWTPAAVCGLHRAILAAVDPVGEPQ